MGRVGMGRVGMVLDLVAEFVMGRVCQGPSLSWAEFAMCATDGSTVFVIQVSGILSFFFLIIYLPDFIYLFIRSSIVRPYFKGY